MLAELILEDYSGFTLDGFRAVLSSNSSDESCQLWRAFMHELHKRSSYFLLPNSPPWRNELEFEVSAHAFSMLVPCMEDAFDVVMRYEQATSTQEKDDCCERAMKVITEQLNEAKSNACKVEQMLEIELKDSTEVCELQSMTAEILDLRSQLDDYTRLYASIREEIAASESQLWMNKDIVKSTAQFMFLATLINADMEVLVARTSGRYKRHLEFKALKADLWKAKRADKKKGKRLEKLNKKDAPEAPPPTS